MGLVASGRSLGCLLQSTTTMRGGKSGLKERITLITSRPRMSVIAVLCLLVVVTMTTVCTFTDADPVQADTVEISKQGSSQETSGVAAPEDHKENSAADPLHWAEPFVLSEKEVLEARAEAL